MSTINVWRGDIGTAYAERNAALPVAPYIGLWRDIAAHIDPLDTVLEVGAGEGVNLKALATIYNARLVGVEPNAVAREALSDAGFDAIDGHACSIPVANESFDMAFTSAVLIHVPPNELERACREIYRVSRRYIACIEYFSHNPEEIEWRGRSGLLFKRDFGGFWLDTFPDLRLRGYGFAWKRASGLDDVTWWVFEK